MNQKEEKQNEVIILSLMSEMKRIRIKWNEVII